MTKDFLKEIVNIIQDPHTQISEISNKDYRLNFKIFSPYLEQYYSIPYSTATLNYQTIFAINLPDLHLGFIKDFIVDNKVQDNTEFLNNPSFMEIYRNNKNNLILPEFLQNYEML